MPLSATLDHPSRIADRLAARTRRTETHRGLRCSAVLAGMTRMDDGWHLLMTQRTDTLEHHKGQVSFPGGACEPGETLVATALREAREEIGLREDRVDTLGLLDDIWTPSGYNITPVVGVVASVDGLAPNPAEVARILTLPLAFFDDPRNARSEWFEHDGTPRRVWFYDHPEATVWGATAFIIRDLLALLHDAGWGG